MSWNQKKLWGVEFTNSNDKMLIGRAWHRHFGGTYQGEPARALLFTTRKAAREWCKEKRAQYAERDDLCAKWRFRPVRVRETVRYE